MTCRHCGRAIAYAAALGYFWHVASASVWCDDSATTKAEP